MKSGENQGVEVKVRALIVDPNSGTPVLVLKDVDSEDMIPIWIGACEANAIASAIENTTPQRPMTHDLLRNLIAHMGFEVQRIIISELRDNTYFATIELADFDKQHSTLDARPSDAIALALRCACPIVVSREVFQEQNRQEKAAETKTGEDEWPEFINEGGDFSM